MPGQLQHSKHAEQQDMSMEEPGKFSASCDAGGNGILLQGGCNWVPDRFVLEEALRCLHQAVPALRDSGIRPHASCDCRVCNDLLAEALQA